MSTAPKGNGTQPSHKDVLNRTASARWQAEMAPFFEELDGRAPDEGIVPLTEVFHLDEENP